MVSDRMNQPTTATDQSSWLIQLERLNVAFGDLKILDNVTARFDPGKITAVIGPNGAGKTTLLLAILGLIPYKGQIHFIPPASRETGTSAVETRRVETHRRPIIGYVPQRLDFDRGLPITVADFLAAGKQTIPLWWGKGTGLQLRIQEALNRVNAVGLWNRPLGGLSGGELQRVLLAQALLRDPQVLLLDEPASAVDVEGEALFYELLHSIHRERHLTTVWVSHDLSVVMNHADRVICLNRAVSCVGAPEQILTPDRLRELFGPNAAVYSHHDHDHRRPAER